MAVDADILAVARPQIMADEGFRPNAYPDALSGGEPWTIGYGSTEDSNGLPIQPGDEWTQAEAESALDCRLADILTALDARLPWWRTLDAIRAAVLPNMAYQMGVGGLEDFSHALAAMQGGNWMLASADMLASDWSQQAPERAERLAAQMRTGVVQA